MESTIEETPWGDIKQEIKVDPNSNDSFKFISAATEEAKVDASESLNQSGILSAPLSSRPNGAKVKSFTGSGVFDNEGSSPLQRRSSNATKSLNENEPLKSTGPYCSQAKLITSKAVNLQLHMNDFQTFLKEKIRIAENHFPGESPDWQAWYAESMVWSSYFKDKAFPGIEPARLFPLQSNVTDESTAYNKNTRSSGGKWIKFADPDSRPVRTGANITPMVDSYRPSDSVVRTGTDRAIPLAIDSYRPGLSSPSNRSRSVNNSPTPQRHAPPVIQSNRSVSVNNSSSLGSHRAAVVDSLNRSASVNNSSCSRSTFSSSRTPGIRGSSRPVPPTARVNRSADLNTAIDRMYMTQERVMENKAIELGIRREFFQYLQKARDKVRAEHRNCSSGYRHWAADTMVWARFFNRDPFPAAEPRDGPDAQLHARQCPMSQESLNHSQRISAQAQTPTSRSTSPASSRQSPNRSERITAPTPAPPSRPVDPRYSRHRSERLSAPPTRCAQPALPSHSFNYSEQSGVYDTKPRPVTPATKSLNPSARLSELQKAQISQPPLSLTLALSNKRRSQQPPISNQTRAISVNTNITWTTATTVNRIAESFSTIDANLLDLVENYLKCHLRSCHILSGDLIIWNEAFFGDDSKAFEQGDKFLNRWLDVNHSGRPVTTSSFSDCWKQFVQSEQLDSRPLNPTNDSPNPQAVEKDWEQYASTFYATELDRLMIEESAKAEGKMRLVYDEVCGEVVSLHEFARRVVDRVENRSAAVSESDQDRTEELKDYGGHLEDTAKENGSKNLNDSERVGKRKVDDDEESDGPAEKRAKL